MINARSIATLGLGFGVVAITTLGLVGTTPQPPAPAPFVTSTGGGGFTRWKQIVDTGCSRQEEEELTLLLALMEL